MKRRWKGRWAARRAGRIGGKRRGYTLQQSYEVIDAKREDPKLGRARLARRFNLTEEQVRAILAEAELQP